MDDEYPSTPSGSRTPSLHLPFAILALAIAVLLVSEIASARENSKIMAWQRGNIEKQITSMKAADTRLAEAVINRQTMVKQSTELQKQLQDLLNDVLELAKTDDDANQVIAKWNVKRNDQAPAGGATDSKDAAAAKPAAKEKP